MDHTNVQTVNKDIVNAQPRGCRVVCISDVTFMTEIMSAKRDDKRSTLKSSIQS